MITGRMNLSGCNIAEGHNPENAGGFARATDTEGKVPWATDKTE